MLQYGMKPDSLRNTQNPEIEIHGSALSSHSRASRKTIIEPTDATQILHNPPKYEHSTYSENPISGFGYTIFENFQSLNQTFTAHHHSGYSVGITHEGLFLSQYGKGTHAVYRGATRVLNPMEAHGGSSQNWSLTNFYPTVALMRSIYRQIFHEAKTPLFEKHVIEDQRLYGLLVTFFRSVYYGADMLESESAMIEALSYLILQYAHTKNIPSEPQSQASLSRTIDLIQTQAEHPITLECLAREAGLSKYHFLRTFKQHTGLTPHQYILSVRVQKATEQIIAGESIAQASFDSGFSDQSHFTRHFKRIYGYTPRKITQKSNIILYK
jgi:AraC-like DNA-binding protein